MGKSDSPRLIRQTYVPLPFDLPVLGRKRPRAYEEWKALARWNRLPRQERIVPGFMLRKAREEADLSQQELAKRLSCSQQAVSQAERWHCNPTVGFMQSWAGETGCDLILGLNQGRPAGGP